MAVEIMFWGMRRWCIMMRKWGVDRNSGDRKYDEQKGFPLK